LFFDSLYAEIKFEGLLLIDSLANVEGELNPKQTRLFTVLQAREVGLRAQLAAKGNSSHAVGYFFLTIT
jgi:hypothetical protein